MQTGLRFQVSAALLAIVMASCHGSQKKKPSPGPAPGKSAEEIKQCMREDMSLRASLKFSAYDAVAAYENCGGPASAASFAAIAGESFEVVEGGALQLK